MEQQWRRFLWGSLAVIPYLGAMWLVWEAAIWALGIPPYVLPTPRAVMSSLLALPEFYARHTWVTFLEAASGAVLGFCAGVLVGIFMCYGGRVAQAFHPVVLATQVFPKEALAPIFIIALGFGIFPKILISALVCFFPVAINTAKGLKATPEELEKLAHVVGANARERFARFRLPFAAPYIMASLRVCMTLSIIGAVVGEFVGSSAGLGHVIRASSADLGIERAYAALILLGILGAAFYGAALWVENGPLGRYSKTVG
jgi:NitT/TauT family transport system permease protein